MSIDRCLTYLNRNYAMGEWKKRSFVGIYTGFISEELPFSLHTRHKHLAFGRIRCYVVEYENRNMVNEHFEILHLICKL